MITIYSLTSLAAQLMIEAQICGRLYRIRFLFLNRNRNRCMNNHIERAMGNKNLELRIRSCGSQGKPRGPLGAQGIPWEGTLE
jgi:hypothetical protein